MPSVQLIYRNFAITVYVAIASYKLSQSCISLSLSHRQFIGTGCQDTPWYRVHWRFQIWLGGVWGKLKFKTLKKAS